jgi:hypothetical protein
LDPVRSTLHPTIFNWSRHNLASARGEFVLVNRHSRGGYPDNCRGDYRLVSIVSEPASPESEMQRYRQLVRQCLDLARKVDDPAAAERLKKLARDYQDKLERLLETSEKSRKR